MCAFTTTTSTPITGEYLASSSCDGTVKVWQLGTSSVISVSWNLVPNSNSFSASPTLCRMAWLPSGAAVCVPTGSTVHLYGRDDWQLMYQLKDEAVTAVGERQTGVCMLCVIA